MNLSLYLLFAPGHSADPVSEAPGAVTNQRPGHAPAGKPRIYNPHRPGSHALVQARYRSPQAAGVTRPVSARLGFGAAVVVNAFGFLAMTAGLFMLLQIARVTFT